MNTKCLILILATLSPLVFMPIAGAEMLLVFADSLQENSEPAIGVIAVSALALIWPSLK